MKSSDIHIRAISEEMPKPSITKICLKITYLKFHSNFPGANELKSSYCNSFEDPAPVNEIYGYLTFCYFLHYVTWINCLVWHCDVITFLNKRYVKWNQLINIGLNLFILVGEQLLFTQSNTEKCTITHKQNSNLHSCKISNIIRLMQRDISNS